jgi:hypothetical protein
MDTRRTLLESLAYPILAADGIGAIWQLQLDAAFAYRRRYARAADAILDGVRLAARSQAAFRGKPVA